MIIPSNYKVFDNNGEEDIVTKAIKEGFLNKVKCEVCGKDIHELYQVSVSVMCIHCIRQLMHVELDKED